MTSREDRIHALAKQLEERGLASSASAAVRLAEGMVDIERKVIQGSSREEPSERERFQKADSPLFHAATKAEQPGLDLPDDFQAFVNMASQRREFVQDHAPQAEKPAEIPVNLGDESWKVPEKPSDSGYKKTSVEASDEAVIVRHVEATSKSDVTEERGIVAEKEDLAKQHGVDLFNIFKTGK